MMRADAANRPTFEQCTEVLRAAEIDAPLTECTFLSLPDYSPNIIGILNDRYVLRASTIDGAARFARERRALDHLRAMPGIPQILGAGTLELGTQAHYLLLNKIPGQPVFSRWLAAPDTVRAEFVTGLVAVIRRVHRLPARGSSSVTIRARCAAGRAPGWPDTTPTCGSFSRRYDPVP